MSESGARGVIVTRPEAEAVATGERLRALGWAPLLAPMLRIVPRLIAWPPGPRPQAVLVTSGNALAALPQAIRDVPLLAVGDATAARARALGFACVRSVGADATALAAAAREAFAPRSGALLLPAGAGYGRDLAAALRAAGFRVVRRVAYIARPVRELPSSAGAALAGGHVAAALFFSAATARAFVAAAQRARVRCSAVDAVAISAAAAAPLSALPWRDIRIASRPTQDSLLECL